MGACDDPVQSYILAAVQVPHQNPVSLDRRYHRVPPSSRCQITVGLFALSELTSWDHRPLPVMQMSRASTLKIDFRTSFGRFFLKSGGRSRWAWPPLVVPPLLSRDSFLFYVCMVLSEWVSFYFLEMLRKLIQKKQTRLMRTLKMA